MKHKRSLRLGGTALLLTVALTMTAACNTVDAPGRLAQTTDQTTSVTTEANQTSAETSLSTEAELTIITTTGTTETVTETSSEETEPVSASTETTTEEESTVGTIEPTETSETPTTQPTSAVTETTPSSETTQTTQSPVTSVPLTTSRPEPTTEVTEPSHITEPSESETKKNGEGWLGNLEEFFSGVNNPTNGGATTQPGTQNQPIRFGEIARFDGSNTLFDRYEATLQVTELIRGEEASDLIQMASALNPSPTHGHEYLIARIGVTLTDRVVEDDQIDIGSYSFTLVSEDGDPYPGVLLIRSLEPSFKPFTDEEPQEALIAFQVAVDDDNPSIVFLARNYGGLWLETAARDNGQSD